MKFGKKILILKKINLIFNKNQYVFRQHQFSFGKSLFIAPNDYF
ncbi:hypothetical protein ZPR_2107 [Zunongwangia profunda SM-A87]|uniref:Uncharacterized protein n=1 Tax=Zunongwangia profunda (strain DSM 18752 / CCTCC AB 206139 / SM-A87) TaxID=655815 RepID=D5BAR9_ZUNPS|nr:hypothetical protein ZPR_2107 [Zunongwangia profunda SM-A87]